ncbi:hypothetical protein QUA54_29725 [Microcoleus sp. MOSTC5]|uniref:hypothetical protein n=1 Tax=Microcoleus sp. MOSTC5 TaxID=3055378 RepID=UPI002FD16D1F
MTEKKSVTFRCDADLLEAIDNLGRDRYPAKTPHGYDRSKILMEVLRLNIEALSDGSVVLPTPSNVGRQASNVRHNLSDSLLDARITEMVTRKTEPLLAELANIKVSQAEAIDRAKAELRIELLRELAVQSDRTDDEPLRQQLDSMPPENHQDYDQLLESSSATIDNQRKVVELLQSRLREERAEREKLEAQLAEPKQSPATAIELPEPAGLLNQLKAERKKSTATLADVEAILEMIEKSCDDTSQEN